MAQTKKHYKVDVYIYGESAFIPFRELHKTIETWAERRPHSKSKSKAFMNQSRWTH